MAVLIGYCSLLCLSETYYLVCNEMGLLCFISYHDGLLYLLRTGNSPVQNDIQPIIGGIVFQKHSSSICLGLLSFGCTTKWYGMSFLMTLDTKKVFIFVGYYRLL